MSDFLHTPFFCEENIWQLCQHPSLRERERKFVVWITSCGEVCAVWKQKAAKGPDKPIGWDYHVVLLAESESGWELWDLDTTLSCPTSLDDWLSGSFPFAGEIPEEFEPRFRLVAADQFVASFSSDRSHMLDRRGRYRKPPPAWPAIRGAEASNFSRWLDAADPIAAPPISLDELRLRFS